MNKILNVFFAFVFFMFLSASVSTATTQIPSKYDLGGQLEQVHRFWKTNIIDWQDVDNQSLIIETSPGSYYLLVLALPSYELPFKMNRIGITNSGSMIREGNDSVIVYNSAHFRQTYPIDRIFKISGSEKMRSIVKQLQGQKNETHTY